MTISYPRPLPGQPGDIAQVTISKHNVIGQAKSSFTFETQQYRHQGTAWGITVELNPLVKAAADEWDAWLTSLQGRYGTFLMGDPNGSVPRGSAGGTPKVATGQEAAFQLQVYGATSSVDNWLRAGDYIQLGHDLDARMYLNLVDVNTTSGGVANLDIWPRLRTMPASGAMLAVASAVNVWRLTDNAVSKTIVPPGIYLMSFSAEESLP